MMSLKLMKIVARAIQVDSILETLEEIGLVFFIKDIKKVTQN